MLDPEIVVIGKVPSTLHSLTFISADETCFYVNLTQTSYEGQSLVPESYTTTPTVDGSDN